MSKIVLGTSDNEQIKLDLDVLLRTHLLICASTGGGKSYLIRRIVEQAASKIPIIIVDREGEFATLRSKYDFVLVGPGGETPADPRSAKLVAHTLLDIGASAVCDLFEMKSETRHEWVKNFYEALADAPKRLWGPTIVILDEAHTFAPEKGQGDSPAYGAVTDFAGVARKRGHGCIFATQRLSKLSKNATAEMYNQAAGPTARQADRDRAAYEMGISGKKDINEFADTLRTLEPGNFFFQGRAIAMDRVLVKIGPVETEHGQQGTKYTAKVPPTPEKIKALLPKLADLPKMAEEKAKTEAELRSEIRSLKAQLRAAPVATKEIKVSDPKAIERAVDAATRNLLGTLRKIGTLAGNICEFTKDKVSSDSTAKKVVIREDVQPVNRVRVHVDSDGDAHYSTSKDRLGSGAKRLLAAAAQWYPNGIPGGQWRAHAGLKKSGTFTTYVSRLVSSGLIVKRDNLFYATEAGVESAGESRNMAPSSTEEVLDIWRPKLGAGPNKILNVVLQMQELPKKELAELSGFAESGTFTTYLSRLKTARLIQVNHGIVSVDRETLLL